MSKRMRELADKAGYYIDPDFDIEFEELAELIIGQMLDITDAHTDVFQTDRDKALIEHIKQSVKQHFGVKE